MRAARPSGGASLTLAETRYELLEPIASGGMGTVYVARRRSDGAKVALKIPHAFLAEITELRLELVEAARIAARIWHPNVVAVLDADQSEEGFYVAMEYIEGDTLAAVVRASGAAGLPLGVGMRVLLDALAGLHAAHELRDPAGRAASLVHGDVSPQNILVGVDGRGRLTDFGAAKVSTRRESSRTGALKGTVAYMSPEQARGLPPDRRCDVWAAGVIAWELAAGRRLHASDDIAATLRSIVAEEPPPLETARPDVPRELAGAIASALRMAASERCPDAATLAGLIEAGCRADGIRLAEHAEVGRRVTALGLGRR